MNPIPENFVFEVVTRVYLRTSMGKMAGTPSLALSGPTLLGQDEQPGSSRCR